jgi:DNA ligase-1
VKTFAALYRRLDAATSTHHKNQALQDYLRAAVASPWLHASAAWTVYFLAGGKPRQ